MDLAHAYFDIIEKSRDDDGNLRVYGKATDSSLDIDEQVCDETWLRGAMPSWFKWGNIREQHSNVAAGVATSYEASDDGHWIEAKVVDPGSVRKVEEGVLKGFSIGIKSPRIAKDNRAKGGRIVGGEIVEVSLVDRPANSNCKLVLAKAVGSMSVTTAGANARPVTSPPESTMTIAGTAVVPTEELIEKRDVSTEERSKLEDKGHAMEGGGFPIANIGDLKNAIQAIGRAKNPDAAKAHIKRRAKALGREDLIPDTWKIINPVVIKTPEDIDLIKRALGRLIAEEGGEMAKGEDEEISLTALLDAVRAIKGYEFTEAIEGEPTTAPPASPSVLDNDLGGGIDTELGEQLDAEQETQPNPGERVNPVLTYGMLADLVKSASLDERRELRAIFDADTAEELSKVQAELTKAQESLVDFEERLGKVESEPARPTPSRMRKGGALATEKDPSQVEADYYRRQAELHRGERVADGYLRLAETAEAKLLGGND